MSVFGRKPGRAFRALHRDDKKLGRKIVLMAVAGALRAESWTKIKQEIVAFAKPKAVDWDAILAFIKELQPIIQEMIENCGA